jgi:hypothetical protein
VIENPKLIARITELTLRKSPEADAFPIAHILLTCATTEDQTAVIVELCRWLAWAAGQAEEIEDSIVDFLFLLGEMENSDSRLTKDVFHTVNELIQVGMKCPFERIKEFRKRCEGWLAQWRQAVGACACGNCSARLLESITALNIDVERSETAEIAGRTAAKKGEAVGRSQRVGRERFPRLLLFPEM